MKWVGFCLPGISLENPISSTLRPLTWFRLSGPLVQQAPRKLTLELSKLTRGLLLGSPGTITTSNPLSPGMTSYKDDLNLEWLAAIFPFSLRMKTSERKARQKMENSPVTQTKNLLIFLPSSSKWVPLIFNQKSQFQNSIAFYL